MDVFPWPLMEAEFQWVSSQNKRIKKTRNGVSMHSKDVNARMTALSMSSGAYSGLARHEPV
jgi:hypothetical protein